MTLLGFLYLSTEYSVGMQVDIKPVGMIFTEDYEQLLLAVKKFPR
jgi:hypothetical protein